MAGITVGSDVEAEAIIAKLEGRLNDMSPFFKMLERNSGALDVAMREVWKNRFGMNLQHSKATIAMRAGGEDYYGRAPGPQATKSSPYFYWTGALQAAAMKFTEVNAESAKIDPDKNYRGPLEGVVSDPYTDIMGEVVPDENIWNATTLGNRIERDLTAYLFKTLEGK